MSEQTPNMIARVATVDGSRDPYDHLIALVDTTNPQQDQDLQQAVCEPQNQSQGNLRRVPTKSSVKDQLLRRKYAKWREPNTITSKAGSTVTNVEDGTVASGEHRQHGIAQQVENPDTLRTAKNKYKDFNHKTKKKPLLAGRKEKKDSYVVDVLYECQRGSFFFGIPLYSHSSLLNFDPSPWVNKDFKDSAVNITNAQVPDPSWEWSWKTWYVDMSYDVDEEGWQYSFAFGGRFAWHGTHPWFHSFVRRRRWLRKRVKKGHAVGGGKSGSMNAGHKFTNDYFTIHPKRDHSPSSGIDGESRTLTSTKSTALAELEQPPDEIKDIASLLKALRFANIDREKIDLMKQFIKEGGEELAYLGENMPHLISVLVFQNSKRQVLSFLKETADEAQKQRYEYDAEDTKKDEVERRRMDNLSAAVDAADKQINGLEYWSDRKHILKTSEPDSAKAQEIGTVLDSTAPKPIPDEHLVENIRGISNQAEIEKDPNSQILHENHKSPKDTSNTRESKGKEKELIEDYEKDRERAESPPRLGRDQVLIPDDDG